jgi:hypothetical protein
MSALSFNLACHEVETAFGIRLKHDINSMPVARYEAPDETWLIEVSIPPDNRNDPETIVVLWYDDYRENSVLDAAVTANTFNDIITEAWQLRCRLLQD